MSVLLDQQVSAAKIDFPSLRPVGPLEYSVSFDARAEPFRLVFDAYYPSSAPRVFRGSAEVQTPMTDRWQPFFSLHNLCAHFQAISAVRAPMLLQTNEAELRRFLQRMPPDRLAPPSQRAQCLHQFPPYAQAQAAIADSRNQRARIATAALEASLIQPMDALRRSFEQRGGLRTTTSQMLLAQADEIKRQIDTAKQDMFSGRLTLAKYLADVRRLKIEEFTARVLADRCPVAV
jgi:hypothetical protein